MLGIVEEVSKVEIHLNTPQCTQNNTLKIQNWKTLGLDGKNGFWFKRFTSIHDRLANEMNKYIQKTEIHKLRTMGTTTLIKKDLLKEMAQKTHKVLSDDMENTNGTN